MTSPTTKNIKQSGFKDLHKSRLNIFVILVVTALLIAYSTSLFSQSTLANFSIAASDLLFLTIVLAAIFQQLKKADSLVDPIYWILLAAAFSSWFLLSIAKITFWESIAQSARLTLNDLAYFLFFALMIAAIEVKSYTKASQLLETPNLLVWGASLSFTLGAFIFLVLTDSPQVNVKTDYFSHSFSFYIVMDGYLALRWIHLAWKQRNSAWLSYLLFGLAFLNWLVSDLLEGLSYTKFLSLNEGSWIDWLWFTPYLLIFFAIRFKQPNTKENHLENLNKLNFSNAHLFNSPLFFAACCLLLHLVITDNSQFFSPLNATQLNFFGFWLSLSLILATFQFLLILDSENRLKQRLLEKERSQNALELKMEQQAQSLKEQAASNQAILETTHNAIFTLDFQDIIRSCNPAACGLLGKSENEINGSKFIETTQAEGELNRLFTYQSYRQKLLQNEKGIETEAIVSDSRGNQIPVHVTVSPDRTSNEGLLVVSLANIVEQKQAEQEAHNLKDQFTQNISHEFRTPLTIINGVVDNMLNHDLADKDKKQLETAKRNVLRMIRMVEQLLELSRIANDPIKIGRLNLGGILRFVCTSFEEVSKNQNIDFSFSIPKEAWVEGNPQAAEKVLFNLLSNAFKYTPKGSVKVELKGIGEQFKLTIEDSGVGIAAKDLPHIFERFHRVKSESTERIQGVGIGLALVQELCLSMKWDLTVDSKINQGTCFTINVEQTEKQSDSAIHSDATMKVDNSIRKSIEHELYESQTKTSSKPLQKSDNAILIVEDNPDMLAHINEILSPHHQCLLADNGEEGLRLAMDYLPDIIVSDVMMPGMDGFQLLKTLKKTEITSHIPVILLTARSDSESKIKGLEFEADDYLSKPFDATELSLRVNNQLKSRDKLQTRLIAQLRQDGTDISPPVEDKFIVKLENIFEENYKTTTFSVLELANSLAMSDRQVQRKIKSLLGLSPLEALKQFRLKKAKLQLEAGEQIGVVAQACGFTSQSYFGRVFKESFGLTPKQYQQRS